MLGGVSAGYEDEYEPQGEAISVIGPCSKGRLEYGSDTECGGCQKKLKKDFRCSKCQDQKYCSRECQRKDFRRHKTVCRTPEDREAMFGKSSSMWMHTYYMASGGGAMAGLGALMGMSGVMSMSMGA
ncbi:hypothetical protein LTR97_010480 [Elasticomyces elasticus]|uniref:MYND-type domain-containing protein n=1 Tax=Elasticomyces elasticus TaxID=574655 RepID=A0AAN7W0Q1_9PEZI|nr:hypothetical protein LTR97_010480 [Elasticomyces elasticus]KAK5716026.1 hypothetical protein LTR15_009851 [Elasticomyces elasticus]